MINTISNIEELKYDFGRLARYYDSLMCGDDIYVNNAAALLEKYGIYDEDGEYIFDDEEEEEDE